MKQFFKIFRFEFRNYYTNKVFVFLTLFLVVAIGIGLSVPALASLFSSGSPGPAQDRPVMAVVSDTPEHGGYLEAAFSESFPGYRVELKDLDAEGLKAEVLTGVSACGFFVRGFSELDYCVMDLSIYDDNLSLGTEALRQAGLRYALHEQGLSDSEIEGILDLEIRSTATVLGTAQFQNYFYTYIMIFALYMVIVLYGNMVATNVASEKSSRAMELLITTAHPQSLMFGKIMASCMAGLTQLALVFGSSLLFYRLNETHWDGMPIVSSIFNMPLSLFLYMILFFLLGFLMYACLYAAIGSTVSKLEDLSTAIQPLTMTFVVGFMVVVFSMSSGQMDSPLLVACSFIPLTSPMAMFTRIAMSQVPVYQIILSILILIGSVIGSGIASAKIYRIGVMLYGNRLKFTAILKLLGHKDN
ncbi:MAG: ABC transporter permease [Clostridia bacterium]|nr:ABC transporter permease [Clostridia bacterium]